MRGCARSPGKGPTLRQICVGPEAAVLLPLIGAAVGLLWAVSLGSRFRPAPVLRRWGYPAAILVILTVWASAMTGLGRWHLFVEYWPISVTMVFGSIVAGATAEGGGAIAFPVFTKLFSIAASDARDFGLMIQSVGMMLASGVIVLRSVRIDKVAVLWVTLGAAAGQLAGLNALHLDGVQAKILFSLGAANFGIALLMARFLFRLSARQQLRDPDCPRARVARRALFVGVGVAGGAFASVTGTGADMLSFVVLTLGLGLDERIATPTTVIIMGLNSVVGFALRSLSEPGITLAWDLWMVAVPVVIFGAPLGALIAAHATRDQVIAFLCTLIAIDLVSTLVLVEFGPAERMLGAWVCVASVVTYSVLIGLRRRRDRLAATKTDPDRD